VYLASNEFANKSMASLAQFFGILIQMRPEKDERHHRAHIHAKYAGRTATFDVKTREIIAQSKRGFPKDQTNLVKSWMFIHQEELEANWRLLNEKGDYFKIAPLA